MQSNNQDELRQKIMNIKLTDHVVANMPMRRLQDVLGESELDAVMRLVSDYEHRKTLEARIDELYMLDTGRHYGKDYQDSLDELDEYKRERIAELQSQLPKKERNHE